MKHEKIKTKYELSKNKLNEWLKNFPKLNIESKDYSDNNCYLMVVIGQERPNKPFQLSACLKIPNLAKIPIRLRNYSDDNVQQKPENPYLYSCNKNDSIKNIIDWLKNIITTAGNLYLRGCPFVPNLNVELFLPFDYLRGIGFIVLSNFGSSTIIPS